ncbi:MAG: acetyl-CoA carboxylase biotin carboxylase subunit [Ignavibacteriaceae bacterium]|nr:acetyl-CoA carboxylase biotin carboxylase subunit [Ignavibacteriaceae bacterium]
MFNKILIANRGEIAVRIIRACKELSITSAAIYSEADTTALHTLLADEAYFIGAAQSSESYLNKEKIIKLAKEIGADAIHPGYGFFSENADFINEVEQAGITYIGPSAKSVMMMGSKTAARQLMKQHNVPIVPGTTSPINNSIEGVKIAKEIGYPILLKASAGGGGKGMRKISEAKEFASAFEATKREALKSFANDEVYIEKYIENPKHIEVQIIADKHGNYRHVFERECSIQRRHQKIIEEAPSSFVDEETRLKLTVAAINAAKACNYYNAGTIEFLMDKNKEFYFLEMNTRLQVEHPVSEYISGLDLVKEQISIAMGNKISFEQNDIKINGHSIECRIYAEDAENNFMPSTGILTEYSAPSGPGVRVDAGFKRDSEISIYYDPLIAKLILWAPDRSTAISRALRALDEYHISGVITNIHFLKKVIASPPFVSGNFDITYIDKQLDILLKKSTDLILNEEEDAAAIVSALLKNQTKSSSVYKLINGNNNRWEEQLYE